MLNRNSQPPHNSWMCHLFLRLLLQRLCCRTTLLLYTRYYSAIYASPLFVQSPQYSPPHTDDERRTRTGTIIRWSIHLASAIFMMNQIEFPLIACHLTFCPFMVIQLIHILGLSLCCPCAASRYFGVSMARWRLISSSSRSRRWQRRRWHCVVSGKRQKAINIESF